MTNEDLHADVDTRRSGRPRRPRHRWLLAGAGLLALLLTLAMLATAALWFGHAGPGWHSSVNLNGLDIDIDGEHISGLGGSLFGLFVAGAALVGVALMLVLGALVTVPLVLLGVFVVIGLCLGAVALPLLLIMTIALSPVLLVAAFLWWLLRRKPASRPTMAG